MEKRGDIAPEIAAVRAHVIDSLKKEYEALQVPVKQATFTAPTKQPTKPKVAPTATDEVYTDKEGNTYPIYVGAKGGRYIIRTSKKTGKEYKSYLKD